MSQYYEVVLYDKYDPTNNKLESILTLFERRKREQVFLMRQALRENDLKIVYTSLKKLRLSTPEMDVKREVSIYRYNEEGHPIDLECYFTLEGRVSVEGSRDPFMRDFFNSGATISIGVSTEAGENHIKGKQMSRLMIGSLCIVALKHDPTVPEVKGRSGLKKIEPGNILAIDTDASNGFWDSIGMKPFTRLGDDNTMSRAISGRGYEKYITFSDILKWAFGESLAGGKKTKRIRRTRRTMRKRRTKGTYKRKVTK